MERVTLLSCSASHRDAARLIDQERKHGEAACVTEVRLRFRFWKASDRLLSRGKLYSIRFPTRACLRSINNYILFVFFLSRVLPESSAVPVSGKSLAGYESLRKCHEILVGPPSQSRRILHAPFVALSRIINRKIALIFSSLRFVKATAIAEARLAIA